MSFSVASYCICSPRASSASVTSASLPIEGGPPCCHGASPLSTPLPRKTTRKPRPLPQRTRCGVVPSAAHRWPLLNDSQPHNSNSDLHRFWPRPHEITYPHTALSARFRASRRSVSPLPQTSSSVPVLAHFGHRFVFPAAAPTSPLPALTTPANFYTPRSIHSICITPASAAPAVSF